MPFEVTDSRVVLLGACTIEEAEGLHEAVRAIAEPSFDLPAAGYMHTSVVQVLMASGGRLAARPAEVDPVLGACLDTMRTA